MARYLGNYEVIKELGAGHFGTVYMGVGEVPGRGMAPGKRRLVAIKKLNESAGRGALSLLLQEFALLDQVKHRGIVRVYEYLEDENAVVMEYIHGVTLREVLEELARAREQVFTEAAVEIGCEVADALYQAYTTPGDNGEPLRLVHRDLKPANVMLTPTGEVKILDFGLARVDNAEFAREQASLVRGTPVYMAPEQARAEKVDHRTDVFAIGLILFELLMNHPAYQAPENARDPVAEVLRAVERGDLKSQCQDIEQTLPALGPIITRMLQPRPADRYANGQDVLVDLRRQLYRDRGAYLKEFCEFFFGAIHPIGPAPSVESFAGATGGPRRKSIEDRLAESKSKAADAAPVRSGPRIIHASATPTAPSSPPPTVEPRAGGRVVTQRTRAPEVPSKGDPMPSDSSGGKPPRPPVGGGASRATPFVPVADGAARRGGRKVQSVGQRSPDETGMLEMVPLTADKDQADANADPSATAFFAIPAPKADRSRPTPSGRRLPRRPSGARSPGAAWGRRRRSRWSKGPSWGTARPAPTRGPRSPCPGRAGRHRRPRTQGSGCSRTGSTPSSSRSSCSSAPPSSPPYGCARARTRPKTAHRSPPRPS